MRLLIRFLVCFFAFRVASAEVRMDETVRTFLNSTAVINQSLPVLISYKSLINLTSDARSSAEVEVALINQVSRNESSVFSKSLFTDVREKQSLWIVNGTLANLNKSQLFSLLKEAKIQSITSSERPAHILQLEAKENSAAPSSFTWGLEKIGMVNVRQTFPNLDGSGIRIGILDTGIDGEHPDLKGKTKIYKDFVDPNVLVPRDDQGHGTHVAGTVAGGNTSGVSIGVAPCVDLVIGKVFDQTGSSKVKNLLLAMQWIADPDGNPATLDFPKILSNSWTVGGKFGERNPSDEPLCTAVETLTNLGITTVFAAGNMGYQVGSVQLPAACPLAFSVGATDSRDQIAVFSSRGPATWRSFKFVKPEVSAPGVDTVSAAPGGGYKTLSGTSMAAPHAVGALALILQARPSLDVVGLKKILVESAQDLGGPGPDGDFGAGRIDVSKALK